MKKLIFIALAVALPCCVAAFASPSEVTLFGWPALLVLAVGAYCLQWLAFIPARLAETERFYDLTGSLTYVVITLSAVVVSPASTWPQWLVAALVIIWAGRLGRFLFERIHQAGGDQRFDHIKVSSSRFLVAWTLQGAWVVMTSCAAITVILSSTHPPVGVIYAVGALCWLVGFTVEVVADRQKSQFRADPRNEGSVSLTRVCGRGRVTLTILAKFCCGVVLP